MEVKEAQDEDGVYCALWREMNRWSGVERLVRRKEVVVW